MSSASVSYTNTSFAVLGSNGALGPFIIDALSKHPGVKKLIVFSRPSSSKPSLPPNAELITVDYNDHSNLVDVFRKNSTDVVVSTFSHTAIWDAQKKAALAAKEAGVKLFVPSEYGLVTIGHAGKGGVFSDKDEFAQFLKSIDLPYVRFFTGLWHRFVPWVVGYDSNQKVNIVGKGETPITLTAEEDIGGFIAHVLTTLPQSRLSNSHFRLQSDRLTVREIADRLKIPYTFVDSVPGPGLAEERAVLVSQFETGAGSTGWDVLRQEENPEDSEEGAGSANRLWEGHIWKKLEDVVTI